MISFTNKGDFSKTFSFLKNVKNKNIDSILSKYGQMGVDSLSKATPIDSGETANSWNYKIENKNGQSTISWYNTNIVNGCSIAIILQYGHGTGTGGYVEGRDYINPAMKGVFDKIADQAWKEVVKNG